MRRNLWIGLAVAVMLALTGDGYAQNQFITGEADKNIAGTMIMCQTQTGKGAPCGTLSNSSPYALSISTMNNMPSDSTAVRNWAYPYDGDVMCMWSSAAKTIRLRHIWVSVTGTQAMQTTITLARRNVHDVKDPADTPYLPPRNKNDENNPSKSGQLQFFHLKPTFGQPDLEGELMRTAFITVGTGTPGSTARMVDFDGSDGQPIVLRADGQVLCLNITTPVPGGVWDIAGEWMETDW